MTTSGLPIVRAQRLGSFAADIVGGGGAADIIAVFERSFYLLCSKGIVALCSADLGIGPINILIGTEGGAPPWQGRVRVGMKAQVTASRITTAGGFGVSLQEVDVWSPPPFPTWDGATATRGLARIVAVPPRDGLAALVLQDHASNPTAAAAAPLVAALKSALPVALATGQWSADACRAATLLVGLGPGLTPSGDDLLGGLLLALSARGALTVRDQLWDALVDELDELTVPVSAMHLTAAAHGMGHEAVHALIACLLCDDHVHLPAALDAVTAIGATSGWDAVAGLHLGLSA